MINNTRAVVKVGKFILTQKQIEVIEHVKLDALRELLLVGGSRSGKTSIVLFIFILRCLKYPGARFCFARKYLKDIVSAVLNDTFPKICALFSKDLYDANFLNKQYMFYTFKNGSQIWFTGLADEKSAEKALGNEYSSIMFNEISQISAGAFDMMKSRLAQNVQNLRRQIFADCNPPHRGHWTYKRFVQKVEEDGSSPIFAPGSIFSFLMNPVDNKENLPEGYIEETLASLPWRKRMRFLDGKWGDEVEGALWKISYIKRIQKPTSFDRIVVAIDPQISVSKNSNETGIIVAACKKDTAYVLEDASGRYSPSQWARKAVSLYENYECDKIIAEINQGGELVKQNLKAVENRLPVGLVRAKRSKVLRAEPIVSLYQENKVYHAGEFPDLESQMISWTVDDSESPDRIDALVYAIFDLLLNKSKVFVYAV